MRALILLAALAACTPDFAPLAPEDDADGGLPPGEELDGGGDDDDAGIPPDASVERYGWRMRAAGTPRGRDRHAMVYSPKDRQVLLIGGITYGSVFRDTWGWNGYAWEDKAPATVVNSAVDHSAAEDKNGNVVLFGGKGDGGVYLDETWIWDGTNWTPVQDLAKKPGPRGFTAMAYDPDREVTVLYGGFGERNFRYDDTWQWDGASWEKIEPPQNAEPQPEPIEGMKLAFDYNRRRVLMHGGVDVDNQRINDLWSWDGVAWTKIFAAGQPGPRAGFAMAYDLSRHVMVIFGGEASNDSWELDRMMWRPIIDGDRPQAVSNTSAAYDRAGGRVVMFGGYWEDPGQRHEDVTYVLEPLD